MFIKGAVLALISVFVSASAIAESQTVEGITFDQYRGSVFVPVRTLGGAAKLYVGWEPEEGHITLNDKPIEDKLVAQLFDGSNLVHVRVLEDHGFTVHANADTGVIEVSKGDLAFDVVIPEKKTEINLKEQKLIGWQGSTIVIETKISSGRRGFSTPIGEYTAGPEKSRFRRSRKYDNSPMPFSVQLRGGYFVHGYTSVPNYPASHGCIRMPLTGKNAAKYFFEWVDKGSAISIRYDWSDEVQALRESGRELDASR